MNQNQVANSALCVVVASVVGFVPVRFAESVVGICPNVVLHMVMSRYLISSDAAENFTFLAEREPVHVDPSTVHASKCNMKIFLADLVALYELHVG